MNQAIKAFLERRTGGWVTLGANTGIVHAKLVALYPDGVVIECVDGSQLAIAASILTMAGDPTSSQIDALEAEAAKRRQENAVRVEH